MIKSIIAAVAENRVIGNKNTIPWHYAADLKHFKETTVNHAIVMGRKTFDSIGKKALPGRRNIIVTRDENFPPVDSPILSVVNSITESISLCTMRNEDRMFFCGGAQIYKMVLPIVNEMIITEVPGTPEGNILFPEWDVSLWSVDNKKQLEGGLTVVYYTRK